MAPEQTRIGRGSSRTIELPALFRRHGERASYKNRSDQDTALTFLKGGAGGIRVDGRLFGTQFRYFANTPEVPFRGAKCQCVSSVKARGSRRVSLHGGRASGELRLGVMTRIYSVGRDVLLGLLHLVREVARCFLRFDDGRDYDFEQVSPRIKPKIQCHRAL
jgi:hypothetical protein